MSKLYDHKQWWKSPFKYVRDYSAFHNSDILLTDTEIHRQYFSKTFFIPKEKLHTLHIGTQIPEKTATKTKDSNTFNVGFYGRYQPLQGASEIVKAAALLQNEPDISFTMIGNYRVTSAYPLAQKLRLKNINFILEQPTAELFDSISSFDACLGVFGRSMKADAVIPNKIYHYAGFGKAIITRETPGVKELFEHKKNIHLCEGSPESIATAILDLKKDHSYSENIGANARVLMEEQYSPIHVAERFVQLLKSTIS